jgi:hypothetical protein
VDQKPGAKRDNGMFQPTEKDREKVHEKFHTTKMD